MNNNAATKQGRINIQRDLHEMARQMFARKADEKVKRRNQHDAMMRQARKAYERTRRMQEEMQK